MIESTIIDEGALIIIEEEYYNRLFNGKLCSGKDSEEKKSKKEFLFKTMSELFVYAAVLGLKEGRRKEINKPQRPFRWSNILHSHKKNLLLLVTAQNNSLEFLKDASEVKKALEEYASCGLSIINQEIKNNPSAYSSIEEFTYRIMEEIKVEK